MKITGAKNLPQKKKRAIQGKISRKRPKDNSLANTLKVHAKNIVESAQISKPASDSSTAKPSTPTKNIFGGLNINISDLSKTLSTQCVPVTKTTIPKHFPKKEKRKLRHEAFLKKIEKIAEVRQDIKKKKRRKLKKSSDVDMASEVSTAETEVTPQSTESTQPPKKQRKANPENLSKRPIPKTKQRVEQDMSDIQLFKKVMTNPVYQSNPGAAISNYVLKKVRESIQTEA